METSNFKNPEQAKFADSVYKPEFKLNNDIDNVDAVMNFARQMSEADPVTFEELWITMYVDFHTFWIVNRDEAVHSNYRGADVTVMFDVKMHNGVGCPMATIILGDRSIFIWMNDDCVMAQFDNVAKWICGQPYDKSAFDIPMNRLTNDY